MRKINNENTPQHKEADQSTGGFTVLQTSDPLNDSGSGGGTKAIVSPNKVIETVVEIEDLTVAYAAKPVLWDVDLDIPKGKISAIIGPNGAGKTTLLKTILGLLKPVTGSVRFTDASDSKRGRQSKIAYVPQSGSVDWDFPATAEDVVLMGCYGKLGWIRRPRKKHHDLAKRCLDKVGMAEYCNRQISQLSGGQQQRVFLARALAQEAEIYFMDEPFKGVDAKTERAIVTLLKDLKAEGKTVVVVHHDLQTVADYFDWVILINLKLVASGPTEEIFTDENLKATYHMDATVIKGSIDEIGEPEVNVYDGPVAGGDHAINAFGGLSEKGTDKSGEERRI